MHKPNLVNGTREDIRNFVVAVVGLAANDFDKNNPRKSGEEIVDLCAGDVRNMHKRLATTIYNQTRRTLELTEND